MFGLKTEGNNSVNAMYISNALLKPFRSKQSAKDFENVQFLRVKDRLITCRSFAP